jgi:hypothetical protein
MTGILKRAENDAIIVIEYWLSKWAVFVPCLKEATAEYVAQLFLNNWVRHKKFSWDIVGDRG